MAADGSIIIDTRVNTDGFDALSGSISGLPRILKRIGLAVGAAFSVKALVDFSREAINLGSDLQEVQNVVDVTFGNLNGVINNFAQNALEQFGLSELAAKQYTSTLGAMFKSMGFATGQAAEMSMAMAGLAGDMASFYNLDTDEAFAKIRSGISGETEPLKQLGINLSVANLEAYALANGITQSYNAMTQQEQAMLRYNYLLAVTADAQGDFARTSGSWANQTRILTERFKALKATIGRALINALTPVIKVINIILAGLQALANAFRSFTALLFGDAGGVSSGGSAGGSIQDMTDSMGSAKDDAADLEDSTGNIADNTEEAAEAAKRYLASFDEINKLGEPETPDPSDTGYDDAFEDVDFGSVDFGSFDADMDIEDKISPKIQALVDKIKQLIEPLKKIDFTPLKESLQKLGESFKNLGRTIGDALEWAWFNILVPFAEWTIEEALPGLINLLAEAFDFLNVVLRGLEPLAKLFWEEFLAPIASWTGDVIIKAINGLADGLDRLSAWIQENYEAVNNILTIILSIAGSLGALAAASSIIEYVGAVAALAPEVGLLAAMFPKLSSAIGAVAALITGTMIPSITGAFSALAGALGIGVGWVIAIGVAIGAAIAAVVVYWDEIKAFFTTTFPKLLEQAKQWLTEKMRQVQALFEALAIIIPILVQSVRDKIEETVEKVAKFIDTHFIQPVKQWADDLKDSINRAFEMVGQKIRSTFERAKTEIKSGFIAPIKEDFQGVCNWISDKFNAAKNSVINTWRTFPSWVSQNVTEPVIDYFNNLTSAVVDAFNRTAQSVSRAISSLMSSLGRARDFAAGLFGGGSSSYSSSRDNSAYWSTAAAYSVTPDVPHLAKGAVIPPNQKFMAVLGDQKSGVNVEAPLSTIQEALRNELSDLVPAIVAGCEGVMRKQDQLLEAVLGIEIGDDTIAQAVNRYNRKMAMVRGN